MGLDEFEALGFELVALGGQELAPVFAGSFELVEDVVEDLSDVCWASLRELRWWVRSISASARSAREYPINGVGGVFFWWVLAVGVRSAKVVARVFRVGFQRHAPAALSGALGVQRSRGQVGRFQRGLLVREVTAGANGTAETSIQAFDRVRSAQDLADLDVVVQERHELGPGIAPEPNHHRVGLAPLLSELFERSLGSLRSRGFGDRFQVRGDLGSVLLGRVAETVAQWTVLGLMEVFPI